jgi:hypothetical protein
MSPGGFAAAAIMLSMGLGGGTLCLVQLATAQQRWRRLELDSSSPFGRHAGGALTAWHPGCALGPKHR